MTEAVSKEAQEIVAVATAAAEAIDRRDLDGLLAHHYQGPEATSILPGAGRPARGWGEVRQALEQRISEFTYSRTEITNPSVSLMGDWALLTYQLKNDSRIHDIDFAWVGWVSEVYVRKDGRWLVLHRHASDVYRPDSR